MSKTFGNFTDFLDFSRSSGGTALRKVSYGSELVTNGTFDTDLSGWTYGSDWSWSNGTAVDSGTNNQDIYQTISTTAGKIYQITFTQSNVSGGNPSVTFDGQYVTDAQGVDGTYRKSLVATSSSSILRLAGAAALWTIDNVSVKEVTLDSGSDDPVLFNHPDDTPRIEYATDGTVKGLLIEEARTNLITYSEAFENAAWTKTQGGDGVAPVVTANHGIAPDGNQTADRIEFDSGAAGQSQLSSNTIPVTLNVPYTFSVWMRSLSGDVSITMFLNALVQNVTVTSEWQRFNFTATETNLTTTDARIAKRDVWGTTGNADILIWGAQAEQGSFATSYIPTSGATATRSADDASIAVENFGYNQDEGTVVVEFEAYSWAQNTDTAAFSRVWEFYGNFGSNADGIFRDPAASDGTYLRYRFNESDATTAALGPDNLNPVSGVHKVAVALGQGDAAIVMDGGTPATGSGTAAMDKYADIHLGQSNGSINHLNGHIRDFQYYPRRLTNRQLQEVTGATNTYDYTTVEAGTITRSPVATGSDLVGYSGFSATNYLEQPYNSDLDFGTGDFCVMGWSNQPASGAFRFLISRDSVVSAERFFIAVNTGSEVRGIINDNITPTVLQGSAKFDGTWKYVAMIRKSGTAYLYVNGVLQASSASTQNITNTSAKLFLGIPSTLVGNASTSGSLALWRISATAPTAEQIAKIYEDEKVLFQDGAQATLYGSSDAVTALAHDDVTNLLHVGTSAGRSVFQGLRRVENTTDAVGTAISASNGLVVEE